MKSARCCYAQLPIVAVMLCLGLCCLASCRGVGANTLARAPPSPERSGKGLWSFDPYRLVELRKSMKQSLGLSEPVGSVDGTASGASHWQAARRAADVTSAPMRFGTVYDDLSKATPEQAAAVTNETMPWVVSTLSRMFQVKDPVDDMKILPTSCQYYIAPNSPLPPSGQTVDAWICIESANAGTSGTGANRLVGDYYVPVYICPPSVNPKSFTMSNLASCEDLSGPKKPVPLDMVLRISTNCDPQGNNGTIAYSQPVDFDVRPAGNKVAPSWRPAVATVVLCPLYFELSPAAQMQTLTHELMHGMGFGTLLPIAEQVVGTSDQDGLYPTSSSLSQVTQQVNLRGRTRTVATSARVVEEARVQFGCADLVGAELESTGGEGTSLGHLAKRLFMGDLMVGYAPAPSGLEDLADKLNLQNNGSFTANLLVMSRVELALMEDLGYYVPNYNEAGFLRFGYKGGCDFTSDECSAWEAAHPGQDYFCNLPSNAEASAAADAQAKYKQASQSSSDINTVAPAYIQYVLSANSCNADRSALGVCGNSQVSTGEQCPMMQNTFGCNSAVFDQLVEMFDQSSVPNLVASGPDSRCVAVSNVSLADVNVGPTIEGGTYSGSTCLSMRCDSANNQLVVTVGTTDFNCPSDSTFDLATLPFSPPFSPNSLVYCPNYDEMCSTDTSTQAAADFGDVTCDALAACNTNGDCYKGVCYCKAGWTGCDCGMKTSDPAAAAFDPTTCKRWASLSTDALDIGTDVPNQPPPNGVGTESSKNSAARLPAAFLASLLAGVSAFAALVA